MAMVSISNNYYNIGIAWLTAKREIEVFLEHLKNEIYVVER
jgi:hypothetical protein